MLRASAIALVLLLAGCGGTGQHACAGVEAGGMCWVGHDGLTISEARAAQVYEIAKAYWGQHNDPEGWTVEFGVSPIVHSDTDGSGVAVRHTVDGEQYFGWACPEHRLIIVHPFGEADCIERSVIFHELGHAWGVPEGDSRLYGEYALMREAMKQTHWKGCPASEQDDEDHRDGEGSAEGR